MKCTHCNGLDFDTASSPSTGRATCRGCGTSAEFPPIGDNLTATEQAELKYSNHTPGPWEVEHPTDRPHPVVTAADGSRVAEVQYEHDARLIAAAPSLLNMLQRMVDETAGGGRPCLCTLEHARNALAQAKGS